MLSIWLWVALLLVLALGFIFWPMVFSGRQEQEQRDRHSLNVELYEQRCAELKEQLSAGDIDEAQYAGLQKELDLELLGADQANPIGSPDNSAGASQGGPASSGRIVFLLSAALLSVFVFSFYQYNGASEDIVLTDKIRSKFEADTQAIQAGARPDPALARRLMSDLEERLRKDPDNVQYRYLLARNATDLQEYPTAINAYRAILEVDESPLVMGELAQLLFVVAGNRVTPDAELLIDKTLAVDPNSHVALGLDGIRHYQNEQYAKAIAQWEKAIKLLGPQSAGAQSLAAGVLRARSLLAEQGGSEGGNQGGEQDEQLAQQHGSQKHRTQQPVASDTGQTSTQEASALSLQLKVALASGIEINPEHAVFIYARAWQGAPMPLAIARLQVKDLPAEIELSEAMAMAPGMSIATFPKLELVARVSASGQAVPQSGDWEVSIGPVANDSQEQHQLTIERQL